MSSPDTCPRCGMFVPPWPLMNDRFEVIEGPKLPHQCPPPYPYETARYLYDFHSQTGIPTTGRIKARIMLGLELGPSGATASVRANPGPPRG